MKNTYVKPEMQVEEFLANRYVAACGKTPDGVYHFKCDAPAGTLYYYKTSSTTKGTELGSYHPCGATHDTTDPNNFYEGFIDYGGGKTWWGENVPNGKEDPGEHVLVWRGDNGKNGHATVSLTMGEIDVVKS
ncbi:MAG: hypothetical protein MJZ83_01635 [Bacteroidaceae bacterium]|nr:hypothetical protein [Bacteroidaceae bacterium]